jgi:hypothetical protein
MSEIRPARADYILDVLASSRLLKMAAAGLGVAALSTVGAQAQDRFYGNPPNDPEAAVSAVAIQNTLSRTAQHSQSHGHKGFKNNRLPRITKVHKSDFDGNMVPAATEPSGLSHANMYFGNRVRIAMFSESGRYALALSASGVCGWIERDTINNPRVTGGAAECKKQFGALKGWEDKVIGKNYCQNSQNNRVACVDGTFKLKVKQNCNRRLYGDYHANKYDFTNMNYPYGKVGFDNYLGRFSKNTPPHKLHYRFTTPDKKAARLRVDSIRVRDEHGKIQTVQGWVYISKKSCVKGYPQGGTTKTKDTVGGAKPNKKR